MVIWCGHNIWLTEQNIVYLIINKNKIKVMSKTKTTNTVKRGRPVVAGSKRQAVLAMRDAKRNAGIEIKRGRPAGSKKTTDITVEAKPKATKAQKQAALATVADVNEA
jgi:hypothetical protein